MASIARGDFQRLLMRSIQTLLGSSSAPTIGASQRADRDLQLHADQRSTVTRGKAAYLVPRAAGGLRCRVQRRQFMYAHDGDCNGVLYHIGTSCGKTAFRNPAVMKQIVITASSPTSRFTNPARLSSRTFVESSSALPRQEQGQQSSWWRVDFGEQRRIMCDYYTVRHDGSQDFARDWSLQGSEDEENWVDLRRHENDRTITSRGQYASFPVTGHAALLPFRWLQVASTHKCSDGDGGRRERCPKLCIGALEFYGVLQLLNQ
ncbi:hypothetical protein CYMTET_48622 [Cymbomonas tetramitiformis]|uniref:F5/8 type C domain-containing protein n=1 Tax=Cymbomonas tetramitiformis TaxID=36881 RepID=A0AAE0EUS6_9CHLO|nr:hypothetical protein CYMTET_48622 [Cymbomonas tetramitiformis]